MTERSDDQANDKKPYAKPEIKQVALRPEEAVLAACKTSKISGPNQSRCNIPGWCSSGAS